jgi:hypothetical protein
MQVTVPSTAGEQVLQVMEALLRQSDHLNGAALATLPYASHARLFLDSLEEQCAGKLDPGQVSERRCPAR